MPPLNNEPYWRSLAEWSEDPEFAERVQREFPTSPMDPPSDSGVARRRFLQLMGASMALASGAACRWEKEKILAFTRRPAGHVPGVPKYFSTMMELSGTAQPLKATSYDGRPIKVDGSAEHPQSRGASTAFAQASILEMYDPDRSQRLHASEQTHLGEPTWDDFAAWLAPLRQRLTQAQGNGLLVVAERTSSPTQGRLMQQMRAMMPQSKWVTYEPLTYDNERVGTKAAFGAELRPLYAFDRAHVVVALDAELFVDHPNALVHSADFAAARRPEGEWMARLWVAESRHSTTGGGADHRLPVRSQQIRPLLLALMAEVIKGGDVSGASDLKALSNLSQDGFLAEPDTRAFVQNLAADLRAHRGQSLVAVGCGQPAEVHQLAHQLNAILGNVGHTVRYVAHPATGELASQASLAAAAAAMRAGLVDTVLLLGGNPVFDAPADVDFAEALGHVGNSAHLSLYCNETSEKCRWHLPRTHYLEAWGDARTYDGTVTYGQPLIEPLYPTRTPIEVLALLLGEKKKDAELVRETFASLHDVTTSPTGEFEGAFRTTIQRGFLPGTAFADVALARRPLQISALAQAEFAPRVENGALELTFWADSHVYDGRFANNGWLQELPDFMSKLTWDNAAFIAPSTAKALGVKHQTKVKLTVGARSLVMPAYIMPGQAQGSIAVSLGYGRTQAGHVAGLQHGGVPSAGFDTYSLRAGAASNFAGSLNVTPTGEFFALATTQDLHALDDLAQRGREQRVPQIVREGELEAYRAEPDFAKEMVEHPPLKSPWKEFSYAGHRWGMAIDLNNCSGCNACIVACQAENNVPIVGKVDVIKGRSMHWIRMDRYFLGNPDAPKVVSQPMMCQQCELAPCEPVCPVAATVHSSEGLNDMVYNRCIGTRYCSNNCPYKVRRFNFFNYHKTLEKEENQVTKMAYNPEVTVRARGVMEKCTYCVQRIQNVKIVARNERRAIEDGEITPACAQACASSAIVFGDLNDVKSRVAALHSSPRSYAVLEELNTKPRTQYLARVRNPYGQKKRPRKSEGATPDEHVQG